MGTPTIHDKMISLSKAAYERQKQDGDTIAILHKTATELKDYAKGLKEKLQQVEQEKEQMQKTGSEEQSQSVDEQNIKDKLTKIAEDGLIEKDTIDAHVEKAKNDPNHLTELVGIMEEQVRKTKQASESEGSQTETLDPVGKLKEGSSLAGSNIRKAFDKQAEEETGQSLERLDQNLGNMLSS